MHAKYGPFTFHATVSSFHAKRIGVFHKSRSLNMMITEKERKENGKIDEVAAFPLTQRVSILHKSQ